jgi:hypothetical protein
VEAAAGQGTAWVVDIAAGESAVRAVEAAAGQGAGAVHGGCCGAAHVGRGCGEEEAKETGVGKEAATARANAD